jgi:uncharacterized membrane protein YqjE
MEAPASSAESAAPGQAPPLRALPAALLEALRTRLDLAAVEIEIHLQALLRVLVYLVGALACALLAFAFAVTALIVALWDAHRLAGLLGATAVFVGLAALFGALGARTLRRQPAALEGSLEELREDERRARGAA